MTRLHLLECLLGTCVLLASSIVGKSDDPKAASDKKPPAGLRVMNGGHSWSTENSAPLCQAAGIKGAEFSVEIGRAHV